MIILVVREEVVCLQREKDNDEEEELEIPHSRCKQKILWSTFLPKDKEDCDS